MCEKSDAVKRLSVNVVVNLLHSRSDLIVQ